MARVACTNRSRARVDRTTARSEPILVKVLWHRQTHEERESQNKLCPKAVQVAELEETETRRSCSKHSYHTEKPNLENSTDRPLLRIYLKTLYISSQALHKYLSV